MFQPYKREMLGPHTRKTRAKCRPLGPFIQNCLSSRDAALWTRPECSDLDSENLCLRMSSSLCNWEMLASLIFQSNIFFEHGYLEHSHTVEEAP